jgi:hypothetical protein
LGSVLFGQVQQKLCKAALAPMRSADSHQFFSRNGYMGVAL